MLPCEALLVLGASLRNTPSLLNIPSHLANRHADRHADRHANRHANRCDRHDRHDRHTNRHWWGVVKREVGGVQLLAASRF